MPPISEWQTLFSVQAGAAATLTGLVFVSASINLARILETPGLSGRVAESILQFLQVFFICTAALIPRQPSTALAIEILAVSLLSWIIQTRGLVSYGKARLGHPRAWLVIRVCQNQLASIPFFVAGALLLSQQDSALYWLVPGFVFSFSAGIANAWVLLIEILR